MGKALKINLVSQREIKQEGSENKLSNSLKPQLGVGKIKTNFFLPELRLDSVKGTIKEISPPVQKVVSRINKFIENIADDYFLLGLHLISLHSLLRESKLNTDQIKSWYTENINMPYSSAMQCRKVAEVYSENPELIGRYTATGAYLLSSCKNSEEREEIWQEARGVKTAPSTRDLRETIKLFRARKSSKPTEAYNFKKGLKDSGTENQISPTKIRESLEIIKEYSESFLECEERKRREEIREKLLNSLKFFLNYLEKSE